MITKVMNSKIELNYPKKKSVEQIFSLLNKKREKVIFLKTFGQNIILDNLSWKNQLFFGDNFNIMGELIKKKEIKGSIKLIYIDPPYATSRQYRVGTKRTATISSSETDEIAYEDSLNGEEYLEFLRERLYLMKELLADDGSIYVHVNVKVSHYVKVIMDEVFGEDHFINDITRIKCNPKNFSRKAYGNIKDVILFYSKTDDYIWNNPTQDYSDEDIKRLFPKLDNKGKRYTTVPLHAPGETKNGSTGQPWRGLLPPKGRHWRYPPSELEKLDKQGRIEWSKTGNPRLIIYADEKVKQGKKVQDIWEFKDPQYPSYPTQKNIELLKLIIQASSNPGDLVFDGFAGSGTTLIAAEQLGRRWIGIDNSPYAIKEIINRFRRLDSHVVFQFHAAESLVSNNIIQKVL